MNEFKSICNDFSENHYFSGTCLIKVHEDVLFSRAYGFAHKGFAIPNNLDTKFDIASITKLFTAISILILINQGKLSLDDKIVNVVDLEGSEIPSNVTIEHLLTHTSGISDDADEEAGEDYSALFIDKPNYSFRKTSDFLPQFIYKKPLFKAGTNVRYNNCAFILLGMAIEKITGQSYREFVRENVIQPFELANTEFCAMDEINENTAEGYSGIFDENHQLIKWTKNIYSYPPVGSPDGGLYSTVTDLDKLIRSINAGKILGSSLSDTLLQPHCKFTKPFNKWKIAPHARLRTGYAFEFVEIDKGVFCIRKDGLNAGVAGMLSYYPQIDGTIVILSNQDCNIWEMHRKLQTLLYQLFY
ncbi:class A beta-lactamase-related serine hydrolase [Sporolactobacillus shoreae]|uniref:Class A beta-lactamase-related serine hydrolase n=1 Tax=Sporolactobacillus shoreae TaxID=1465501 RepID=A0A4Z0GHU3_9BACL|nr:serine hydrolase domain-containing protein [Sporolactobacillus shoreae]TGA96285.1 class A beta-lactamase-related serine hydrolase [Sporolactobacillus shoreae]